MRDIVSLDSLTVNNVGILRTINEAVLPTRYPNLWYATDSVLAPESIVSLAYYAEIPVAAVRAKAFSTTDSLSAFEAIQHLSLADKIPNAVYIESLAVLSAYRGLGIGSKLLEFVEKQAREKFIHSIVAHVHVDNVHAQEWYAKKGFVKGDLVSGYYKNHGLDNPDAFTMTKEI